MKEDFDSLHNSTIDRWRRKKESNETVAESMEESLRRSISNFIKNPVIKKNIAKEMKGATQNPSRYQEEAGFNLYDDGETITGFEPRPWERE